MPDQRSPLPGAVPNPKDHRLQKGECPDPHQPSSRLMKCNFLVAIFPRSRSYICPPAPTRFAACCHRSRACDLNLQIKPDGVSQDLLTVKCSEMYIGPRWLCSYRRGSSDTVSLLQNLRGSCILLLFRSNTFRMNFPRIPIS